MTYVFLFGALLALLAVVVVVSVVRGGEPIPDEEPERLPRAERREAALEALRRAEFDYETGKLDEREYRELRERYGRIALEGRPAARAETAAGGGATAAPAERGRSVPGAGETAAPGGRTCDRCGAHASPGARFCARCGEPLTHGAEGEG